MPTIATVRGFRLFFYSEEGNPREPLHIHIERQRGTAKYWIEPQIGLARFRNFSTPELSTIESLVREYEEQIARRWHEHFGD